MEALFYRGDHRPQTFNGRDLRLCLFGSQVYIDWRTAYERTIVTALGRGGIGDEKRWTEDKADQWTDRVETY